MSRLRSAIAIAVTIVSALGEGQARAQAAADAPQPTIAPPKLVHFVEAEFPPTEAGKGATVILQIAIAATGQVVDVKVRESAGAAFDAAAVAAARQFVFEPALANGRAIPVKITYRYVFTFVEKMVKRTTADFTGLVRDGRTKQPMANVRVALDTGQQTLTDKDGKFQILDVPAGEHAVTLSGESLTTVGTTETFEVAKRIDATYGVEPRKEKSSNPDEDEEIIVMAPRIKRQVVSTQVAAEQAKSVPGSQGDVLKVVENLPGVARAAAGSGTLVVWGSSPQDTRVYIDGIDVPRLYHDGGYRSIMSSDLVKSVELLPGGYGAEFGRGLGGLVRVALKPLDEQGIQSLATGMCRRASSTTSAPTRPWSSARSSRRTSRREPSPTPTRRSPRARPPRPTSTACTSGTKSTCRTEPSSTSPRPTGRTTRPSRTSMALSRPI
jgi:TonB family protein